jgi:hypothetical protein
METCFLYNVIAEELEEGDLICMDGTFEEVISVDSAFDEGIVVITTDNDEHYTDWDTLMPVYGYSTVLI